MTDELFFAEKGHGAFLHDFPIHVTDTKNIEDCILVTGFPYNVKDNPENCIGHIAGILSLGIPIRRLGSAALDIAYVASGRFDGFWEVSLQSWDFAAGLLLLKEAGGSIVNYDGSPFTISNGGTFLATNGFIEKAMIEALQYADILYPRVTQ
jgi:myo-inositol-1(or 4)-monophosphatase